MAEEHPGRDHQPLGIVQPLPSSVPLPQRLAGWLARPLFALAGIATFVLALELLKGGASGYGRDLVRLLDITNDASALGFGWLLAYVFLSGSPVAAVAITFFSSGVISDTQAFTMITGSRLGASFIVLFVGFLYYLRGHRRAASISIGVLALLITAAIYIPALFLGYWLMQSGLLRNLQVNATSPLDSFIDAIYGPLLTLLSGSLPGWGLLLAGVAALLLAFSLLDRALPEIDPERSAFQRIGRLIYRPWVMFLLGAAITSVTLSVSVSLSILVPLSTRGFVRRENTLPYIMGANITTFIDTLVAALIVGGPAAFTIVLIEMVSVAILSILVLALGYRPFERAILQVQELVIRDNRTLAAFLGVMLVIPLALLLI